jgi:hypothetical protein
MMIALARNAATVASVRLWVSKSAHTSFFGRRRYCPSVTAATAMLACASDQPVALGFDFLRRRLVLQPVAQLGFGFFLVFHQSLWCGDRVAHLRLARFCILPRSKCRA